MYNMIDLKEIKKNQSGLGLLIENDGYISIDETGNRKIFEDINNHKGAWEVPDPFVVDAVFQKFDIENANGRIYPEAVLKKQVQIYIDKYINQKCSIGEADHPECYVFDPTSNVNLILTQRGWIKFDQICDTDLIMTLNPDNFKMEYKPILKNILKDYEGKVIRLKNRNINDLVTPNHKFPIYDRNNRFKGFFTAQDIFDKKIPDQSHCYIPKQGKWDVINNDFFTIHGDNDLNIPIDTWMKFMGIYLSEGHVTTSKNKYDVIITQVKEDVCDLIEEMLLELPIPYKKYTWKITNKKTFVINDKRLNLYLRQFGKCYDKYVPNFIKQQSKENIQIFYDWFVLGDGRKRGNSNDVFSTSKQLALDLNELQLKIGNSGTFLESDRKIDRYINETDGSKRLIKAENSQDMYFSYKSLSKGIYLDDRMLTVTEEDYNGKIFCVEVENHIWYVMYNGKCHWTGNSSSISTRTISHDILELHWEGHTLVGKMRLITSEGFRRLGIISCMGDMIANLLLNHVRIGVSSRGVGSVEQKMGKFLVGDDFELLCWDIVTQPSTPQAWIATNSSELSQFIESDNANKNKSKLHEKIKKLEGLINF